MILFCFLPAPRAYKEESRLISIGTKPEVCRVSNEQKDEKIQVEVQPLDLKFSSKSENAPALNVLKVGRWDIFS